MGAGDDVGADGLALNVGVSLVTVPKLSNPPPLLSVVSTELDGAGDDVGADGRALNVGMTLPVGIPVAFVSIVGPPSIVLLLFVIGEVALPNEMVELIPPPNPPVPNVLLFSMPPAILLFVGPNEELLLVVLLLLKLVALLLSNVVPQEDREVGFNNESFPSPSPVDDGANPGHNGGASSLASVSQEFMPSVLPTPPPSTAPPPPASFSESTFP